MSLARQLLLVVTLLYVLVFAGTFAITVDNTRRYLVAQLASHAQDTATSLGLSLSRYVDGDLLLMKSMVDAIFDRGYYREIRVVSIDGEPILVRALGVQVRGVPAWFVDLLPLATPRAQAKLMAGWRQAGVVEVASHPGHAYAELWRNAIGTLWWSLASFAFALGLTAFVIRAMLRSMGALERQALAIADREFPRIEPLPRTRELRRIAVAMNRMTEKVEAMLGDQHHRVERLRVEAYTDSLTGGGNRRALERDLDRLTARADIHAFGALALVRLEGVEAVNLEHGNARGDALVRGAGTALSRLAEANGGSASRVGGCLFGLVMPDVPRSAVSGLLEQALESLLELGSGEYPLGAHAGLAYFGGGQTRETLLERAEAALRNAERDGPIRWHVYDATETAAGRDIFHETRWREVLERVLAERAFVLHAQAVVRLESDRILHRELLTRIRPKGGEPVTAGIFLPMAARVGLAERIDRAIVEIALAAAARGAQGVYAINLSRRTVESATFVEWIGDELRRRTLAERVAFEVTEQVAAGASDRLLGFVTTVREAGAAFGVDHCGARDLRLSYLKSLKIDYVKIDGTYTRAIVEEEDTRTYVRSLVELAHGLGAIIVAEHVETDRQLELVRALGFDAAQGHRVERPVPLEDRQ